MYESGEENLYRPHEAKPLLSKEELGKLLTHDSRLVTERQSAQLEKDTKKNWDLFYKRNGTRFFKDRHWITREFEELLHCGSTDGSILEVGCGVGNLIYPLIKSCNLKFKRIFACDFSPRAVEFVKSHELYDEKIIKVFQTDITLDNCFLEVDISVDIVTLIFVLSAIHPDNFLRVAKNLFNVLRKGGIVLFRDYGLYDLAQLRFKPGHKIADNFYMRQDGTRSYYFSIELVEKIFNSVGFETLSCSYHTAPAPLTAMIGIPSTRIFVQAKFKKP